MTAAHPAAVRDNGNKPRSGGKNRAQGASPGSARKPVEAPKGRKKRDPTPGELKFSFPVEELKVRQPRLHPD